MSLSFVIMAPSVLWSTVPRPETPCDPVVLDYPFCRPHQPCPVHSFRIRALPLGCTAMVLSLRLEPLVTVCLRSPAYTITIAFLFERSQMREHHPPIRHLQAHRQHVSIRIRQTSHTPLEQLGPLPYCHPSNSPQHPKTLTAGAFDRPPTDQETLRAPPTLPIRGIIVERSVYLLGLPSTELPRRRTYCRSPMTASQVLLATLHPVDSPSPGCTMPIAHLMI